MEQQKSQIKTSPYLWGELANTSLYTPSEEIQERQSQKSVRVPYRSFSKEDENIDSATKIAGVRQNPTFLQNLGYYVSSILGPIHDKSFKGTEEEARKLGYSTYKAPGKFKRYSVNYPVTVSKSATPAEIAKAQFDQYGISSDYARDKSKWDQTMYEYLPGYGYNVISFLENIKLNKKVSDASTGDRVILGNQRRNKADDWALNTKNPSIARKIYNKITGNSGVNYSVQDVSPARQDYRNLHWGYPQKYRTLTVNTRVTTKNDGSNFQGGYAFVPNDTKRILAQARNLHAGDLKYVKGNQLGNYVIGKNNKGESWYYDDWDLLGHSGSAFTGGRSFDVYDRK